jgi:hypothetical protein
MKPTRQITIISNYYIYRVFIYLKSERRQMVQEELKENGAQKHPSLPLVNIDYSLSRIN